MRSGLCSVAAASVFQTTDGVLNLAFNLVGFAFTFGVGLKVSKLHVSYGYAQFNPAGTSSTFTLALHFADLKPKAMVAPSGAPEPGS